MRIWIVAALLLPASAAAQAITYCVGTPDPVTPCGFVDTCSFTSSTGIIDALGDTSLTNPSNQDVQICVDTGALHVESFTLNGGSMNLGEQVVIRFSPTQPTGSWCPDPNSGQTAGMILEDLYDETDDTVGFFIQTAFVPDDPACDNGQSIALVLDARADFAEGAAFVGSDAAGGRPEAFNIGSVSGPTPMPVGLLSLSSMYFWGGDRGLVHGDQPVFIQNSAVLGVNADSGQPLIDINGGEFLELTSTLIAGNGVQDHPLIDVEGSIMTSGTTIAGNAVTGGQPVVDIHVLASTTRNRHSFLRTGELTRNSTFVEPAAPTPATGLPAPVGSLGTGVPCVPHPVPGLDP